MRDPHIDKLADVLVNYSARVKKGDIVGIMSEPEGGPLIEALAEATIRAGGDPVWMTRSTHFAEALLRMGTDEQIAKCHPIYMQYIETVDVHFSLLADSNTRHLSRYDPRKTALLQQGRKPFLGTFMRRSAEGALRWCGTQVPTEAHAQDAEMSLGQYEEFVYRAGLLHLPDPAAEWRRIEERQARVCEFLQGRKIVRFRAPGIPGPHGHDGTDLTVDVSKATWINCCGHENFPDGEVFAGPSLPPGGMGVDGHVNYTFPAVYQGREVHGVRLKFKAGKVVDACAGKGEEFLIRMLDQDPGARFLGEIAIGTNYSITEFSKNTLFDEKFGGTFHAAVGAGYPESGNTNESGLHWDMVCDLRPGRAHDGAAIPGGSIEADGEVFHRDGKFLKSGWPGND
ncbi:MAG: aminopeptidase [Phycisphaerales bacterium]|nr:aminopeptidase [Phycisphaerales bacterium]